jgi:hypothetical protein
MKLYKYLKKAKWKDDLYVDVRIKNNDVDDNCYSYAYQGMVDEIPLYCLTKQVIEISGKILNSVDEGNLPCVVITVLDNE